MMIVALHLGVHATDDDRLLRTLLKNRGKLAEAGIAVPGPGRYRLVIRDALRALRGGPPGPELRDFILDAVLDDDRCARLVLSHEGFLGAPPAAIEAGEYYPQAGERAAQLRELFPQAAFEFHLALCSPATFLPALHARCDGLSWGDFMMGTDPAGLRWSHLVARLQAANPDVPITAWRNEDTPLIWPELLRSLSGAPPDVTLHGNFDLLAALMSDAGVRRLRAWLDARQPRTLAARRKVVAAFLEKFALPGALDAEIEAPGWTQDTVAVLDQAYDADIARVAAMPGVTFLAA